MAGAPLWTDRLQRGGLGDADLLDVRAARAEAAAFQPADRARRLTAQLGRQPAGFGTRNCCEQALRVRMRGCGEHRRGGTRSTTSPRYMIATSSAMWRATPRSCVTTSSATLRSLRSDWSSESTRIASEASSALTGSSQTSTLGSDASARAIAALCRWPPESIRGRASAARASSPTRSSSSRARSRRLARGTPLRRSCSYSIELTVIHGVSELPASWNTSCGGPPTETTSPLSGCRSPHAMRRVVVFPEPLSPTSARTRPRRSSRVTCETACS